MTTDARFDGPGPQAKWRAGLDDGVFLLLTCRACGRYAFPPTVCCVHCGSPDTALVQASGIGTVYSATTVRARDHSYNLSLIDLAEGVRMMSSVSGDPETVRIGERVMARIERKGDGVRVVFDRGEPA